jgi:hypothetical protein
MQITVHTRVYSHVHIYICFEREVLFNISYLTAFLLRMYNFAAQQRFRSSSRQGLLIEHQNFLTTITFCRKNIKAI